MGTTAGQKILPYFEITRGYFPVIDPDDDPIILDDTPAGSFGLAWCYGLAEDGDPYFAVREDIDVDQIKYIGFHEPGHAFNYTIAKARAVRLAITYQEAIDQIRAEYWAHRGFPGTWQDAQAQAVSLRRWDLYPDESFADCFAQAMFFVNPFPGYVTGEWTWNYYLPVDAANGWNFMQRLMQQEDDMFTEDDRAKLTKVYDQLNAEGPRVWTQRLQDWLSQALKSVPAYAKPTDYTGPDVTTGQPRT